eukprot:9386429-Ditylum_brightwellii.AAC.1
MKAYHWPSTANNFSFHKAKKCLDATVRVAKNTWACQLLHDCMEYCTDPIKAWKTMHTFGKELKYHHSPYHTIWMWKNDGSKVLTEKEDAEIFCAHFNKIFNNQHPLP